MYILAAEYAKPPKSKGEVLVFPSGKVSRQPTPAGADDVELQRHPRDDVIPSTKTAVDHRSSSSEPAISSRDVFHWEDLCYDITIKGNERRILDHVDGWVKPGTSTALMVRMPSSSKAPNVWLTDVSRASRAPARQPSSTRSQAA